MKKTVQTILIAALTLVGVSYAQAAWSGPTEAPPGGNVPAPINVGDSEQTKVGILNILNGFNVTGLGVTADSLVIAQEPSDGPNIIFGRLETNGGLIIEKRDATDGNPTYPEDGRLWMRTDL
jgi:hypothetical protein